MSVLVVLEGNANEFFNIGGGLDESAEMVVKVLHGGPFKGQMVKMIVEKHNCGAFGQSAEASNGQRWQSAMSGCWQQGHQREEEGDSELRKLFTLEYEIEQN